MKKYYMLLTGTMLLAAVQTKAQTKIGAAGAPDPSAMLEVTSGTSNNKGLLLPRMTLTQRNAIPAPATGLMIYNTTANQVQVNTGTPAVPIWVIATATNSGWDLVGNSGTNPTNNFIGTTDNQPLVVRTNNTEKVRVTAAGNVGIGSATPAVRLQVTDTGDVAIRVGTTTNGKISVNLGLGNDYHGISRNLTSSGGGANDVALYTASGPTSPASIHLVASPTATDSLDLTQFVLKNTGDVGIGTNTPAQKLHVQGTARISTAVGTPTTITGRNAAGDVGNVALGSGLSLTDGILNTAADNADWNLIGNTGTNPATNFIGTGDAQPLVIRTNNTEKVRVTAVGNMGIGTTSPTEQLHVADTGNASILISAPPGKQMRVVLGSSNHGIMRNLTSSGGKVNDVALYTSSGSGAAAAGDLYLVANPIVTASDSLPIEQFVLKNTGNVGIGTTTPAQKFHVQGTARIATAVGTPTTVTGRNAAGDVGNVTLGSGLALTGGVLNTTADNADWNLTGNTGTNPATNFIGTGDAQPLVIRTNNAEKLRVTAAGNVGIGNASPAFTLDVNGSIKANNDVLTASTSGSAMAWNSVNSGLGETELINYRGTGGGGFRFYSIAPGVVPAAGVGELMRITGTGNVGIGTNTPAQSLHVQGTARIATAVGTPTTITGRNAAGDVGNVALGSGLALTGGVLNTTADNADWNLIGNTGTNPATNFIGTGDAQPLVIRTNNAEKLRITAAGNVGIGNASPAFTLDVNGSIKANNDVLAASSSGSAMSWNSVNSGQGETELINYKGTGGGGFGFYSIAPGVVPAAGVGELMRITGTGNVGIGTTTPAQSLHVQGTARIATAVGTPTTITGRNAAGDVGNVALGSGLSLTGGVLNTTADNADWNLIGNTGTNPATNFIGTSDNQALAIRTNNTEKVRVTSTGNVGIGTQNPLTKLAVNEGSLSVSNTAAISSSAIDIINNGGGPNYNDDVAIHSYGTTAPAFGMWTARGTESAPLNAQANDYVGILRFSTQVNGAPAELNRIQSNYLGNGTTQKSRLTFYSNGDGADLTMAIDSSGYVGIGMITPHYKLDVAGDINAWVVRANGVALTSDARLKRNIANSSYGLNTVMDLRPVVYDKKNSILETDYNRHEIGFIAQEIAKVLPSIVTEGKDADKTLAVSYTELIPVLTKAIQEQQAQIEALKAKNEQLETVNKATAQLMERVKQMEQMMGIKEIEGTSKVAGK